MNEVSDTSQQSDRSCENSEENSSSSSSRGSIHNSTFKAQPPRNLLINNFISN